MRSLVYGLLYLVICGFVVIAFMYSLVFSACLAADGGLVECSLYFFKSI
jgi:hypothetical protein